MQKFSCAWILLPVVCLLVIPDRAKGQSSAAKSSGESGWKIDKIAFEIDPHRSGDQKRQIHIFLLDISKHKLQDLGAGVSPAWSPDGTQIAYCGKDLPGYLQIHVIRADGSEHKQLTQMPFFNACSPDWSPDGTKIVFTALVNKGGAVFVMDKDGGNVRKIADGVGARWSQDGRRLAYVRNSSTGAGSGTLCTMNADGSNSKVVFENKTPILQHAWSPDQNGIFFTSAASKEEKVAIYRVNLDGTRMVKVAGSDQGDMDWPVPSPDGLQLVVDQGGSIVLFELAKQQRTELIQMGSFPSVIWSK
jgi:Tol biopolymer transport system component